MFPDDKVPSFELVYCLPGLDNICFCFQGGIVSLFDSRFFIQGCLTLVSSRSEARAAGCDKIEGDFMKKDGRCCFHGTNILCFGNNM